MGTIPYDVGAIWYRVGGIPIPYGEDMVSCGEDMDTVRILFLSNFPVQVTELH